MSRLEALVLKPRFRFALILLTNRCNLACKHCYVESGPRGHYGLDRDRLLRLVEELHEHNGRMFVSLSGGEALLREDDCFSVLDRAVKLHDVQLISNGTVITPEIAQRIVDSGVYVKISVDGGSAFRHDWMRGKGTFERTLTGVSNLKKAGLPTSFLSFGATIPVNQTNSIDEVLALAKSVGVARVRIDSVAKMGRARHFWPHTQSHGPDQDSTDMRNYFRYEFDEKHGASWHAFDMKDYISLFDTLHVYFDGEVHLYLDYNHPISTEARIGNINKETLMEILDKRQVSDTILRKFLKFAQTRQTSYESRYLVRRNKDAIRWFEKVFTDVQ